MTNSEDTNPTSTLTSRISHTLLHALLVVLVAMAAVALGGTQAQAEAPAPMAPAAAPAPVDPDHVDNHAEHGNCETQGMVTAEDWSCVPVTPAGMAVYLSDQDCAWLELGATGAGQCVIPGSRTLVVAISAPEDDEHPGVQLLVEHGYTGETGDSISAIYAPAGLVLGDDELGTWMVTGHGLERVI